MSRYRVVGRYVNGRRVGRRRPGNNASSVKNVKCYNRGL